MYFFITTFHVAILGLKIAMNPSDVSEEQVAKNNINKGRLLKSTQIFGGTSGSSCPHDGTAVRTVYLSLVFA